MAAKVVWYREAWWVRTRWGGNKEKDKRIGRTKADKKVAEQVAQLINAKLALGTFDPDPRPRRESKPFKEFAEGWLRREIETDEETDGNE